MKRKVDISLIYKYTLHIHNTVLCFIVFILVGNKRDSVVVGVWVMSRLNVPTEIE